MADQDSKSSSPKKINRVRALSKKETHGNWGFPPSSCLFLIESLLCQFAAEQITWVGSLSTFTTLPVASVDRGGSLLFTKIHCPHARHLTTPWKLICSNVFVAKLRQFVLLLIHTSIIIDRIIDKRTKIFFFEKERRLYCLQRTFTYIISGI